MNDEMKCPRCGQPVPATGISSAYGIGDPPTFGARREHTVCPNPDCGAALVRVQDGGEWEVDETRR